MLDGKESPSNVRVVGLLLHFERNLTYWIRIRVVRYTSVRYQDIDRALILLCSVNAGLGRIFAGDVSD
jgi:hypothetical protein